jgi:hypothetical protein
MAFLLIVSGAQHDGACRPLVSSKRNSFATPPACSTMVHEFTATINLR